MSTVIYGHFSFQDSAVEIKPSATPSELSKQVSRELSDIICADKQFLERCNLQRVNFDADIQGSVLVIKKLYLVDSAGNVTAVKEKHTISLIGYSNSTKSFFRKVGAALMPHGLYTPFAMYADEMQNSVKEDWDIKLLFTAILGGVISWLGTPLLSLLGVLIFLAVIDAILSLIPGNVKRGTEKDHTLQSKVWGLITNLFSILLVVKAHEALTQYTSDQTIFSTVGQYFHYPIIGWIFSVYVLRSVKYVANANKVGIPATISELFKRKKK